jgi:hypothetical protein
MNTLKMKYKAMLLIIKTLRKTGREGRPSTTHLGRYVLPDGLSCSELAGLEEIVTMFKLPLLSGFLAGTKKA